MLNTEPFVEAIASALERLLQGGVRVSPDGTGWIIQLVTEEKTPADAPVATISRSW